LVADAPPAQTDQDRCPRAASCPRHPLPSGRGRGHRRHGPRLPCRDPPIASASRSSINTGSAWRSATATASCTGVSVQLENDPLDRFLIRFNLQKVRHVAAVMNALTTPQFVDGLLVCRENDSSDRFLALQTSKTLRQNRRRLSTRLDRRPHLGCGRGPRRRQWGSDQCHHHWQLLEPMADHGSIVKLNQHGRTPFRMSLRTDLAMKNADGRGSM